MKLTKITLMFALAALSSIFFTLEGQAQCVTCQARTTTFVSVGGTSGGESCFTDGGYGCYLTGLCNSGGTGGGPKPPHQPIQPRITPEGVGNCTTGQENEQALRATIQLDANTLRQIGALHPRIALALAMLNRNDAFGTYAKVYLRDKEITLSDVESYLNLPASSLAISPEETHRLQSSPIIPEQALVIYEVKIIVGDDPDNRLIRLLVLQRGKGDPALDTLEIDLRQIQMDNEQKRWKPTGWRVK